MNGLLSNTLIFAAGAALGSVAAWKVLETKYKRIADEEIASVKEMYRNSSGSTEDDEQKEETKTVSRFTEEYDPIDEKKKMTYYERMVEDYTEPKEVLDVSKPYVISPDEFGECDDYDTSSLTYYSDGVLTDDRDEIIEDAEDIVGNDFESHFGEYEDDSVFIRNEKHKTDYEILLDQRNYSDVIKNRSHLSEDE